MTQSDLLEMNIYFDPETWRRKLANTPQGRAAQLKHLILGNSDG